MDGPWCAVKIGEAEREFMTHGYWTATVPEYQSAKSFSIRSDPKSEPARCRTAGTRAYAWSDVAEGPRALGHRCRNGATV